LRRTAWTKQIFMAEKSLAPSLSFYVAVKKTILQDQTEIINYEAVSAIFSVPLAARSKALVFGRSPAEIVGSNPTRGVDVCLLWVLYVVP